MPGTVQVQQWEFNSEQNRQKKIPILVEFIFYKGDRITTMYK